MTHADIDEHSPENAVGRRAFLRKAGVTTAAGALLPLAGAAGRATASAGGAAGVEPDQLFKAGRFDAADRAYAALLRKNPVNARALAGRGRIALLANDFRHAERFLSRAIELAPDDAFSKRRLAECFVRQDQVRRAVPLLRGTGDPTDAAYADQYAGMTGMSYRIEGAHQTQVPIISVDPLPSVRASINGGPARTFIIDTGATLALRSVTAQEAGLRALATSTTHPAGQTLTTYHGVMDSFRVGDIGMGNVPVVWYDLRTPDLPDGSKPAGVIGTELLSRFIATLDYAAPTLVLRRRTPAQVRQARAEAGRTRASRLPLWIAGDHVPCSLGSVNALGPRVASLDTGGMGLGIMMTENNAKRAKVAIDYDHPNDQGPMKSYPISPERISLGGAVGRDVPGVVGPWPWLTLFGFDTVGNFTHEFFKHRAITFDYASMHFYITGH
ncbi:aspartyl protease family protein [Actinomadura citrea]|uniref:aspartyl protease family protein n=1 Tax=Actinomadura citrea TaxID=46158 RepID=UPI002E2ACD8B|nr:aspartyl protease family protein [Actinomadura citrea]